MNGFLGVGGEMLSSARFGHSDVLHDTLEQ